MTTNTKNIEALVDEYCSSVGFTELYRLLKKLDHEDLDVLRAVIEESYIQGEEDSKTNFEMDYQKGYDEGYDLGYKEGWTNGYKYCT